MGPDLGLPGQRSVRQQRGHLHGDRRHRRPASSPAAISSITEYGIPNETAIGCRWNILSPYDTFLLEGTEPAERVKLTYGTSTHPMGVAMRELLDGVDPHAIQTYLSAPVAIQSRAYYLKPQK